MDNTGYLNQIDELRADNRRLKDALLHLLEVQIRPSCDNEDEWEAATAEARRAYRAAG